MRQIKAKDILPGMTIRWDAEMKVNATTGDKDPDKVLIWGDNQMTKQFDGDTPVTVLPEPAPPQPEEPRWIAARAKVNDYRFFRVDESDRPWRKANCMGHIFPYRYSWSDVCALGPVQVVPDQGWTVPDDTPEAPDRIEEWPEDDTALRPYPWRDRDGDTWTWAKAQATWECHDDRNDYQTAGSRPSPRFAPFVRATDA